MNAKKQYDDMILCIEKCVCDQSTDDLMESIAHNSGYGMRDINTVIKYLTGSTLRDYIKERKLMAAYRYLITEKNPNISFAVDISGFDNHSSFTKKFSARFGMPPKEASCKKDKSLLTDPLTWNEISCDTACPTVAEEEVEQMEEKRRFGISQEQYVKIMEASELEAVYGFEPMFSQAAFELAESLGLPMKETFKFVDELHELGDDFSDEDSGERLCRLVSDPFMQFMFFKCDLSVDLTFITMDRIPLSEEDIMQLDPVLIYTYAHIPEMRFNYFKEAFDYYVIHADQNYTDIDFDEYVDMICREIPKEIAFSNLLPMGDCDIAGSKMFRTEQEELLGSFDPIERMAEEDAQWSGTRIDSDFDEENAAYEDDVSDLFS